MTTQIEKSIPIKGKIRNVNIGDIMNGFVIKKRAREIYVELPYLGVGRVYGIEYMKAKNLISKIKEGDEVVVKIIGFDDGYGNFELELQDIEYISTWLKAKEAMNERKILELEVIEINKGGLIVDFNGLRGFVPLSQLTPEHYPRIGEFDKKKIAEHLQQFLGKKLKLRIINVDPASQKLILSEKAAYLEEYQKVLSQFKVGELKEVEVLGTSKFGIFVRFHNNPHIDGLIHINEIPEKYKNLEEVFKKGDKIIAKIIKIEADRVNLSLKDLTEDPWVSLSKKYKVGDVVKGKVSEISEFFAVVDIEGVKGVVLEDFENLEKDKEYTFAIDQLDPDNKKLILTIKK
jgi:small subunit ribosomal protein S1